MRLIRQSSKIKQDGRGKNFFGPGFGYDFSDVRVHSDSIAAESAQSINALAYTTGNNIVFNNGQYAPDTSTGKRLLGHELTHVVQQQQQNAGPDSTLNRQPEDSQDAEETGSWYTVKDGDWLSIIAGQFYGDTMKWPLIYDANRDKISDPDLIEIGWRLFIPPLDKEASLGEGAQEGMDKVLRNVRFSEQCKFERADWEPIDRGNFRLKRGRSASAAVKRILSGGSADCAGAIWVSFAYSVLQTVGPYRFDMAMGMEGEDNQNLVIGQHVALADEGLLGQLVYAPMPKSMDDLLPGDAVYFKNTPDIHTKHPGSPWQGENTIYRGNGLFSGHGLGRDPLPEDKILKKLKQMYDEPPNDAERSHEDFRWWWRWDTVELSEIPGIQWHSVMRLDAEAVDQTI